VQEAEPDLSVRDHPEVFAIGDTTHLVAPVRNLFGIKSRMPMLMPGVAQPAIQEGKYVADVIRKRVAGRAQAKPFWYWDKGDLAIVGRTYAVADLRFAKFAGFPAWVQQHEQPIGKSNQKVNMHNCMGTCVSDKTPASASLVGGNSIGTELDRSSRLTFAQDAYFRQRGFSGGRVDPRL
jgi:hypothetical protein